MCDDTKSQTKLCWFTLAELSKSIFRTRNMENRNDFDDLGVCGKSNDNRLQGREKLCSGKQECVMTAMVPPKR